MSDVKRDSDRCTAFSDFSRSCGARPACLAEVAIAPDDIIVNNQRLDFMTKFAHGTHAFCDSDTSSVLSLGVPRHIRHRKFLTRRASVLLARNRSLPISDNPQDHSIQTDGCRDD
jgi:hypothetical protein